MHSRRGRSAFTRLTRWQFKDKQRELCIMVVVVLHGCRSQALSQTPDTIESASMRVRLLSWFATCVVPYIGGIFNVHL